MITVGSLFSGIGGLELGLERAGMRVVWQVEVDPFCRRVLAKHWPDVPKHEDVRNVGAHNLEAVTLVCGGFPCQDVSILNPFGLGLDGERSGLWSEYARLVGELRPRYVLVENVAALLVRGLDRVLGDLAALKYDAEWDCVPAAAVGAPHRRDRVFILAYANEPGREEQHPATFATRQGLITGGAPAGWHHWRTEPDVLRVDYGVPGTMDRLRSLGNAVVPQVAEWIGHRIMAAAARRTATREEQAA